MPKNPELSKKEKREIRNAKKLEKRSRSNERLIESIPPRTDKPLVSEYDPNPENGPYLPEGGFNYRDYIFLWSADYSDVEGEWSWGELRQWSAEEFNKTIKPSMKAHESDSWQIVCNKTYNGSGSSRKPIYVEGIPIDRMDDEACERWKKDLTLYQYDPARFRVGTNKRIWGFRHLNCFFLVWYERNHKIYPLDG